MEFLGLELWEMVVKLSKKYPRNYSQFESEVARRTVSPTVFPPQQSSSVIREEDASYKGNGGGLGEKVKKECVGSNTNSVVLGKFVESDLFSFLVGRYGAMCDYLEESTFNEDFRSTPGIVNGFYRNGVPEGSTQADIEDALRTVCGMFSFSVDAVLCKVVAKSSTMLHFYTEEETSATSTILQFSTKFNSEPIFFNTGAGITDVLLKVVLRHSMVPKSWWLADLARYPSTSLTSVPRLCKVKMVCDPPTILFVTSSPTTSNKVANHSIHVEEYLDATTAPSAISALAKKISRSFQGVFAMGIVAGMDISSTLLADAVSEVSQAANTEIYKHIVHLQKLIKSGGRKESATTAAAINNPSNNLASSDNGSNAGGGANKADIGLLYRDPTKALANVDLQDADEFTLQEFKNKMNEKFSERVVKPGDPDYKYDTRLEVKAEKASEWDDSDED